MSGGTSVSFVDSEWASTQLETFDPKSMLQAALSTPTPRKGLAEEAILGWLLSLPSNIDPAEAANALKELPQFCPQFSKGNRSTESNRLGELLRDIACWPADRLLSSGIVSGKRAHRRSRNRAQTLGAGRPS